MKDKSKLVAIILVIITILVVVFSSLINKEEEQEESEKYIVTNYSNFYTVNSCLYRVITYLSSENKKDMILVLSENYKNKNNITEEAVLDLFPKVEQGSTYVSTKMYYETIDSNIKKYYVQGYIEMNQLVNMNDSANLEKTNTYFIVYLDTENKIFSIEPYSGEIFMDGEIDER